MFKTMKFWLVISVCFNLLFLGMIMGEVFENRKGGRFRGPPPNEITAFMRAMPREAREEWIGRVRAQPPVTQRGDIDVLANLIAAEPFDAGALRRHLDQNREANDARVQQAQDTMINTLSEMSAEERVMMAERLRKMPKRSRRDHGHRDHK